MTNSIHGGLVAALVGAAGMLGVVEAASGEIILSPQYGLGNDAIFMAVNLAAQGAESRDVAWSQGVGPPIWYGSWDDSLHPIVSDARGAGYGYARLDLRTYADLSPDGIRLYFGAGTSSAGTGVVRTYWHVFKLTFETTEPLAYTLLTGSGTGLASQGMSLSQMAYRDGLLEKTEVFHLSEGRGTSVVTGVLAPGIYQINGRDLPRDFTDMPWTWMQFGLVPAPGTASLLAAGALFAFFRRR